MSELTQLARELFIHFDAEVDGGEENRLHVALPASLHDHFGKTHLTLSLRALADADIISPSSPIFDRLASLLESRIRASHLALAASHDAPDALPGSIGPAERFDVTPTVEEVTDFALELMFRAAFIAEGRAESLRLVLLAPGKEPEIHEHSEVETLLEDEDIALAELDSAQLPSEDALRARLAEAMVAARDWTREASKDHEGPLFEQLSRELGRLTTYYGELIAQAEDQDVRRKHLAAELDRRTAEEVANHRLSIELDALAYALILRPRTHFRYALHPELEPVDWAFDRAEGTWHGPHCPVCHRSAMSADVCEKDGDVHVTCQRCTESCSVCGTHVCTDHGLTHGHLSEKALCEDHVVWCSECGLPTHPDKVSDGVCVNCA